MKTKEFTNVDDLLALQKFRKTTNLIFKKDLSVIASKLHLLDDYEQLHSTLHIALQTTAMMTIQNQFRTTGMIDNTDSFEELRDQMVKELNTCQNAQETKETMVKFLLQFNAYFKGN